MTESIEVAGQASKRKRRGEIALAWWHRLVSDETGDRGTLAELKRARGPLEVLQSRRAVTLLRQLGATAKDAPDHRTRACVDLVRVLAHVREHVASHPMHDVGWKRFVGDRKETDAGDDRPALSEARFRRLMETGEGDEKVAAFVRLIRLLDGRTNVDVITDDFLDWNHPIYGDRVRERWAFHYYAASNALPPTTLLDSEETGE